MTVNKRPTCVQIKTPNIFSGILIYIFANFETECVCDVMYFFTFTLKAKVLAQADTSQINLEANKLKVKSYYRTHIFSTTMYIMLFVTEI